MAIVNEQWLAPDVPELEEIADFNLRYAQKMAELFGFDAARMKASAEQMAALVATYPGLVQALEKMKAEWREASRARRSRPSSASTVIRSAQEVAKAEKQRPGDHGRERLPRARSS